MTRDRKWRDHVMFRTPTAEMTHAGYVCAMAGLAAQIAEIEDDRDRAVAAYDLNHFGVWVKSRYSDSRPGARTYAEFRGWVRPPLGSKS